MMSDETGSASGESGLPHSAGERSRNSRSSREPPVIEGEAVVEPAAESPAPVEQTAEAVASSGPVKASSPVTEDDAAATTAPLRKARGLGAPGWAAIGIVLGGLGVTAYTLQTADRGLPSEVGDLHTQMGAVQTRLETLSALDRRLALLEQRPIASPTDLGPLTKRLDSLEQQVKALGSGPVAAAGTAPAAQTDLRPIEGRIEALERALQSVSATAAPAAPPVDLAPLDARVGKLDQRLAALEAEMRVTKTDVRAREAPLEAASKRGDAAGLAIVAQAIARSVERGTPFPADLEAAANLGAEPARLAPLRAVAEKGAPSARMLMQAWAVAGPGALDAARGPAQEMSLVDRLSASAARLVRVRPVGEVAGDDPVTLAGRVEAALGRGAVDEALAAWGRLPEPARLASRSWGEAARTRVAADEAAKALMSAAVADLARPKGAP